MRSKTLLIGLIAGIAYFFHSCGSAVKDPSADKEKKAVKNTDTSSGLKVYLLPSPLQVASVIKMTDAKYSQAILEKTEKSVADYQVSYLKALNLGIYSIDMGYATVYNDFPTSTKYADKIQNIMKELEIKNGVGSYTIERIQHNRNNNDSLYRIILESYRDAHEYFRGSGREDIGLMILTGAFIEGLYISSSLTKENHNENLMQLIGLQKMFLQNISQLLKKYADKKDIQTIISKMDTLKNSYLQVAVHYDSDKDKLVNASLSPEQLNAICQKTGDIRNEIIN